MAVNHALCRAFCRLSAPGLLFVAGTNVGLAQDALRLTRTAQSGVDSLIATERAWDRNCRAQSTRIAVTQNPLHGAISIVTGSGVIPDSAPRTGSTRACAGKSISGNQVMYKSEPGYHGMDEVSYTVTYVNGRRGNTVIAIMVE